MWIAEAGKDATEINWKCTVHPNQIYEIDEYVGQMSCSWTKEKMPMSHIP